MERDKIIELQYKNLRDCFKVNLVNPILGKDYYNTAMDVYSCDKLTTEHLASEFSNVSNQAKFYRRLYLISFLVNVALVLMFFV